MAYFYKIKEIFEETDFEINHHTYLKDLKRTLLFLLLAVQAALSLFTIVFGVLTDFMIEGIIAQVTLLLSMGFFAWMLKRGVSVTKMSVGVTIYYTLYIIPGIWFGLGSHHALPVTMSMFTAILIILLLEGILRQVVAAVFLLITMTISVADIIIISREIGVISAISRSVSLLLSFILVVSTIWVFKNTFMKTSKALYQRSIVDHLTGAYNGLMLETSKNSFEQSFNDQGHIYAVGMIDLDNFKQINDTFGHDIGDDVLCAFVNHAKTYIREKDVLSRYGGDEFVFLFNDCDVKKAHEIIRRVLDETYRIEVQLKDFEIAFSAGVCDSDEAAAKEMDILKLADKRMYQAKNSGKNSVVASDCC